MPMGMSYAMPELDILTFNQRENFDNSVDTSVFPLDIFKF